MSRTRLIGQLLDICGWLIGVVTILWFVARIVDAAQAGGVTFASFTAALLQLIGGVAAAGLSWGVAEMMRSIDSVRERAEQRASEPTSSEPRSRGADALPTHTVDELAVLLREVRDISLLDADQRRMRLQVQGRAVLEMLQREVPTLLREHNWIEARNRVQDARQRFPTVGDWDQLEKQIEEMRSQVENADIEQGERQIGELVSLGAWERVAEVVAELLKRHPDSKRCHDLAAKLRVERARAEADQRGRLMAQAQEAANKKDWRTALTMANTMVQRYPRSPEAQALHIQLPTLRENAEIQTRRQLEQQYAELRREHKLADALRIAKEVVELYPSSPQAEVLRAQIPKLKEALGRA